MSMKYIVDFEPSFIVARDDQQFNEVLTCYHLLNMTSEPSTSNSHWLGWKSSLVVTG